MRSCRSQAIFLFLTSVPALAQSQKDLPYLLNGVKEIATGRYLGSLSVFGDQAFPVVNGRSDNGAQEPAIAAARFGRGRMVAFTGYVEDNVFNVADTGRLILNAANWAGGEKGSTRVGVFKVDGLAARLRRLGLDARDITLDARTNTDVIFVTPRAVESQEIAPLLEYVRAGGGLIAGAVGWSWQERHPNQSLATEFSGNRLFAPAGLVWTNAGLSRTSGQGYDASHLPVELSHAGKALQAAVAHEARHEVLSAPDLKQASTTLMRAARNLPLDDTKLLGCAT